MHLLVGRIGKCNFGQQSFAMPQAMDNGIDITDVSRFITHVPADQLQLLCKIRIKPKDQTRGLLGEFDHDTDIMGITIEVTPDPDPVDSVVMQIIRLDAGSNYKYKLFLSITNYGSKTVCVVVRRM